MCIVIDSVSGKVVYSDKKGNYELSSTFAKIKLHFSLLGYYPLYKSVSFKQHDTIQLNIQLEPENFTLEEATILSTHQPEVLLKNENYYISDFEFAPRNQFVVLTAVLGKNYCYLMLLDSVYNIKRKLKIKDSYTEIFMDCLNNLNLVAKDSVQQFYVNEKNDFVWLSPITAKDFRTLVKPCQAYSPKNGFYIKEESFRNQKAVFYNIDSNKKYHDFFVIENAEKINQVKDEGKFLSQVFNGKTGGSGYGYADGGNDIQQDDGTTSGGSDGATEDIALQRAKNATADMMAFDRNIAYQPISCPLFIKNDSVLLFDHSNNKLLTLTAGGQIITSTFINYQHALNWKKQVLKDREQNTFYTLFDIKGLMTLCEINTETGLIKGGTKIPLPFPQKIKIKNAEVYYIVLNSSEERNKILYKMRLSSSR